MHELLTKRRTELSALSMILAKRRTELSALCRVLAKRRTAFSALSMILAKRCYRFNHSDMPPGPRTTARTWPTGLAGFGDVLWVSGDLEIVLEIEIQPAGPVVVNTFPLPELTRQLGMG